MAGQGSAVQIGEETRYPCGNPDCGALIKPNSHQKKVVARGRTIYCSRACQSAAARETRPCQACGEPVTRRRCEFGAVTVCNTTCRAALRSNKQEYRCATCGTTVLRTPGNVHGAVYCSRKCFHLSETGELVTVACGGCGESFSLPAHQAAKSKTHYHSYNCRKLASRVELSCFGCDVTIWRYRSQLERDRKKAKDGSPIRAFCDACRQKGGALFDKTHLRKGTTAPCSTCGQPVYRSQSAQKGKTERYCDMECRRASLRGPRVERPEQACVVCGTVFRLEPDQRRQGVKTCSSECAHASKRRKPGERYVEPSGYVRITTPDGRDMPEHRYVMEQFLGRELLPTETVHHKTGGKAGRSNNDLTNLELWSGRHPRGHRVEDIATYCREMLAAYGSAEERERYSAYHSAVLTDLGVEK